MLHQNEVYTTLVQSISIDVPAIVLQTVAILTFGSAYVLFVSMNTALLVPFLLIA